MPQPLAIIVEDDRRLGDTLVDLLELFGLRCEFCDSGARARQQLTTFKPRLVLLDHPFYKRTGLEILSAIRTDSRLRDTKVIVITTDDHADSPDLRLADVVLIKPFSFDALEATLYELLDDLSGSNGGAFEPLSSLQP